MAEHRYRCTHVVTTDYGDDAFGLAMLAVIPDGSHWQDRPETISLRVPSGYKPGGIWRVTIEQEVAERAGRG